MQKDYSHLKLFKCHPQKKEIFYLIKKDKDLKKLFVENFNFKKFKRPKAVSYTHLTLPTSNSV